MDRGRRRGRDCTSGPGWLPGSGAPSHPVARPSGPQRLDGMGGRGRRIHPSPAAPLSPKCADRPRTAAPASVGFSFFVVRLFSCPLGLPAVGGRGRPWPTPKPCPGPAVSGSRARQSRSRCRNRARPAHSAAKTPASPTARPRDVRPRPSAPPALPPPAHLPAAPAGSG